jgi:hypothetical protein
MTIVGRTKVVNPRSLLRYAHSRCGPPKQGCQPGGRVWSRSAEHSGTPTHLTGRISRTKRIPSNLRWNAGARTKESIIENVVQCSGSVECQAVRDHPQGRKVKVTFESNRSRVQAVGIAASESTLGNSERA